MANPLRSMVHLALIAAVFAARSLALDLFLPRCVRSHLDSVILYNDKKRKLDRSQFNGGAKE